MSITFLIFFVGHYKVARTFEIDILCSFPNWLQNMVSLTTGRFHATCEDGLERIIQCYFKLEMSVAALAHRRPHTPDLQKHDSNLAPVKNVQLFPSPRTRIPAMFLCSACFLTWPWPEGEEIGGLMWPLLVQIRVNTVSRKRAEILMRARQGACSSAAQLLQGALSCLAVIER